MSGQTLEALLFADRPNTTLGALSGESGKYPGDQTIKDWIRGQQNWAVKNHGGNLYKQLKAGDAYYRKHGGWQLNYYRYHNFDMGKIMADVKRLAPHHWKPEYDKYLPKETATTVAENLPVPSGIQQYLTKRNMLIAGGAVVGIGVLYAIFK